MRRVGIFVLGIYVLIGSAAADGGPGYGVQYHSEWDEAQLSSIAPIVRNVACKKGKPVNDLLPGDRILKVGKHRMDKVILQTFLAGLRILDNSPYPTQIVVCRGKCNPMVATHTIRVEPQYIDWNEPCE